MSFSQIGRHNAQTPPEFKRPNERPGTSEYGLLSNVSIQYVSESRRSNSDLWLFMLGQTFGDARADAKLRALKTRRFTPEHRQERAERSLRAVHSAQLFVEPFNQWRWAIEDLDAEEQE